jgi:hypothetical protein
VGFQSLGDVGQDGLPEKGDFGWDYSNQGTSSNPFYTPPRLHLYVTENGGNLEVRAVGKWKDEFKEGVIGSI